MVNIKICPKCGSTGIGLCGPGTNGNYECLECGYSEKAETIKDRLGRMRAK